MRKMIMAAALLAAVICPAVLHAQPGGGFGGFGGFQVGQPQIETSEQWKDVDYAGDGQAYHTCDIYLPKVERKSYPVVIHIYGSAWFSNNSKMPGMQWFAPTTARVAMPSGRHRFMISRLSSVL